MSYSLPKNEEHPSDHVLKIWGPGGRLHYIRISTFCLFQLGTPERNTEGPVAYYKLRQIPKTEYKQNSSLPLPHRHLHECYVINSDT